jgi:uncharacterized coiled-coil DUF342 family protein
MDNDGDTGTKDDFLGQIWSLSTTFTEEAMAAATAKAKEAAFDVNRGLVSLDESFVNLSAAQAVLEDAIQKQKLIQLPITVQKEFLSNLQNISKSLQGLTNGVDEIVNLTSSIETLNTNIWKYGLHNLSDQVLGYQKKLNQIKQQELQIGRTIAQLETAQRAATQANASATDLEQRKNEALSLLGQIKQASASATDLLERVKDSDNKVNALYSTIQQNEKQSGELTSNIKTANNELLSLDTSIKKFYGEIDEYRKKINQTNEDASNVISSSQAVIKKLAEDTTAKTDAAISSLQTNAKTTTDELTKQVNAGLSATTDALEKLTLDSKNEMVKFREDSEGRLAVGMQEVEEAAANLTSETQSKIVELQNALQTRSKETIEANDKKTQQLIAELDKLKEKIREQIQQATGFTLFGAFQSRQNAIAESKKLWIVAIGVLVAASVGVTAWIAYEAKTYTTHDLAFWVKLSLTVPLAFALTFCTVQYSRERRLEEEYAFKSSISVSLEPYRDLVLAILEKDGTVDKVKYTDFVIASVNNVFTPPTDKVFDGDKKSGLSEKAFKQTVDFVGSVVKAVKP